jgi:hypothetical protein
MASMATTQSYKENSFTTQTQAFSGPGTISIDRDAFVVVGSGDAFDLASGPWTINLKGSVYAKNGDGFELATSAVAGSSHLTVGSEAGVLAGGAGVDTSQALDIVNSGDIAGGLVGIVYQSVASSAKGFTITNNADATIAGGLAAIDNTNATWLMTIKNSGEITGAGPVAIAFDGATTINNLGTITHSIEVQSATLLKSSLTNGKGGYIGGDIVFSNGDDLVTNAGNLSGDIKLADGKNSVTNSGVLDGDMVLGNGVDTVKNTGALTGDITLDGGADKFTNGGTITGTIDFGAGDNVATNSGTVTGTLIFGDDDNKMTNSGTLKSDITFGTGDNHVTNSGTMSNLILDQGDDIVSNTKFINGFVIMGDGEDSLTNSGTISSVTMGDGNDVFKNTGTVAGFIDLGDDDDTYVGGNAVDDIQDSAGTDTYTLGGGNDQFLCNGLGTFKLDGGAGARDSINFGNSGTVGFSVNLNTKSVTLGGLVLAAQTVVGTNGSGGSIKGFESIIGSQRDDRFAGSAAADVIYGAGGNDFIAGGLGADSLTGASGVDTFVYFDVKDSGITRPTRDLIFDFVSGTDKIDVSAIDTNAKLANDQAFSWLGVNEAYSGQGGEIRAVTIGSDTIIEADVNGDSKTDFSIDLVGTINLVGTDFNL